MKKLTIKDIVLLGEGMQLKHAIKKKNKDLLDFYYKSDVPIAFSTFRTYLSRDKIYSDTFKCSIIKALDEDYHEVIKSRPEQVKAFVKSINDNIRLYNSIEDCETIDAVFELCKEFKLNLEIPKLYRAKAKNFYFRNMLNHAEEFYHYAIEHTPAFDKNSLALYYIELADICSREGAYTKAECYFYDAEKIIKCNSIDNGILHLYHYYIGIMYYFQMKYEIGREHFEEAYKIAVTPIQKVSAMLNIGLMYKKQEDYYEAIKHYNKALEELEEDMLAQRSGIYNNIAEVHRLLNDFYNAKKYIEMALEISSKQDVLFRYLIHMGTYTDIQIQMGNEDACEEYFEILLSTIGKQMDRVYVPNEIKNLIGIIGNKARLEKLCQVIIKLKDGADNVQYRKDLYECLGMLHEKYMELGGKI